MRGLSFKIPDRGILDGARMRKYTYGAYKDKIKVENIITAFFKDYKIRKQKVLQKIEHVCGSESLDDQRHSPRSRGEDLIRQLYVCDRLQYRIQHLEA
jgi:predicted HAD superfamily hydrolase